MSGRRRRFTIYCTLALVASAALVRAIVLPIVTESAVVAPPTTSAVTTRTASGSPRAEPVDPKRLKALLPAIVGGLKQMDAEAGDRSIGEMHSTYAQGVFALDGNADAGRATVKIVDYIGMPGIIDSVVPWKSLEIANETDSDYSRTVTVRTFKALESFTKPKRTGSINVLVANRFVVTIEIFGLPSETLSETATAMKLDELAKLAR